MSYVGRYIVGTGGNPIDTVTGNTGGAVGPDGVDNINFTGNTTTGITVAGNPGTHALVINASDATETQKGVVELATNAEAIAGTASTNLAIIPSSLTAKLGTQTQFGLAYGGGSTAAVSWTAVGTNGQIPIAATGSSPAFASLTSTGGTITFTPGANSLNLEATTSGVLPWTVVTGTTFASPNNGYIPDSVAMITFFITTAAVGNIVRIAGKGAGGWQVGQGVGQTIYLLSTQTSIGVGGNIRSQNRYDCVELLCITANTEFLVISCMGNITVV